MEREVHTHAAATPPPPPPLRPRPCPLTSPLTAALNGVGKRGGGIGGKIGGWRLGGDDGYGARAVQAHTHTHTNTHTHARTHARTHTLRLRRRRQGVQPPVPVPGPGGRRRPADRGPPARGAQRQDAGTRPGPQPASRGRVCAAPRLSEVSLFPSVMRSYGALSAQPLRLRRSVFSRCSS